MALKKLLNGIKKLFKTNHPRYRQSYAVTGGKYLGEFFVYMEQNESDIIFLSLPSMDKRYVPKDKFEYGIKNKILDPVDRLPKDVYNICKEHYKSINN